MNIERRLNLAAAKSRSLPFGKPSTSPPRCPDIIDFVSNPDYLGDLRLFPLHGGGAGAIRGRKPRAGLPRIGGEGWRGAGLGAGGRLAGCRAAWHQVLARAHLRVGRRCRGGLCGESGVGFASVAVERE